MTQRWRLAGGANSPEPRSFAPFFPTLHSALHCAWTPESAQLASRLAPAPAPPNLQAGTWLLQPWTGQQCSWQGSELPARCPGRAMPAARADRGALPSPTSSSRRWSSPSHALPRQQRLASARPAPATAAAPPPFCRLFRPELCGPRPALAQQPPAVAAAQAACSNGRSCPACRSSAPAPAALLAEGQAAPTAAAAAARRCRRRPCRRACRLRRC